MFIKKLHAMIKWALETKAENDSLYQRGQLLAFFIILLIATTFMLTLFNTADWIFQYSDDATNYIPMDLFTIAVLIALWLLNRRGYSRLVAHICLSACIIFGVFLFEPQDLDNAFAFFTFPILISSFILAAPWSFAYAVLAATIYSIAYGVTLPNKPYHYLLILALHILATVSYLISSRYNSAIQKVRESEEKYRHLFDRVPVGLYRSTTDGKIIEANPTLVSIFGYPNRESFLEVNARELYVEPSERDYFLDKIDLEGEGKYLQVRLRRKDGSTFWAEDQTRAIYDDKGQVIWYEGSLIDVTKRKQIIDALRESQARLELFFSQSLDGFFFMELEEPIRWDEAANKDALVEYALTSEHLAKVNQAILDQYGVPEEFALGLTPAKIYAHNLSEARRIWFQIFEEGHAHVKSEERKIDGSIIWTEGDFVCLYDNEGRITGHFGIQRDITEEQQVNKRISDQLARLSALRAIDVTISGSTNLTLILRTILDQVVARLKVDAAMILHFNPNLNVLEYGASLGLNDKRIKNLKISLNENDYAARVVRERRAIDTHQITDDLVHNRRASLLKDEGITCYYGLPLIVKGKVQGVLEVFRRECQGHDWEWVEFLQALANQTAIAIENSNLFDNLQYSNMELFRAYETTIDGWSRALDLRDKETEGHTLRVTELTMHIARSMNIPEKDLLDIRRGCMLHDIGKMGVPDQILLKPGPLTDEEWVLMRKHPIFAYELLHPIEYLHNALDIPHYHHEKWDGSGYPYGLKGEEIPLAARIFAVVDMYDAVTSERPYRAPWSKGEALDHIRSLVGTHFDPMAVEAFLEIMKHELSR